MLQHLYLCSVENYGWAQNWTQVQAKLIGGGGSN